MTQYVEVAVNVPQVTGVFHYHLPPTLEDHVLTGHLVIVPFGKQTVQGVVLRRVDTPAVVQTRPVKEVVDQAAVLTASQLSLVEWLARETLASPAACIALMLPPGLAQQSDLEYTLVEPVGAEDSKSLTQPSEVQKQLVALLSRRGTLRGAQIDSALPRQDWRSTARSLLRQGKLVSRSVLPPPKVQPKFVRTAQLACPPAKAEAALPHLGKAGSKALGRRQSMLQYLLREPEPVEVSWLYAESGGSLADLRAMEELGLVRLGESEAWRDPLEDLQAQLHAHNIAAPTLTRDQSTAWERVSTGIYAAVRGQAVAPILLHGVTGSGKTEIYLRAVEETLRLGRQAIVLVPEIALTPQTVRRFLSRFPGQVGLVHSGLSAGERYDTWRRARSGDLAVIVGPRSALFTPFPHLGLIVVDECHDDSYYQSETPPNYHARETAVAYARLAGALCLMGSATPDVTSTYRAAQGEWQYVKLPARILAHRQVLQAQIEKLGLTGATHYRPLEAQAETTDLPPVQLVDMRQELQSGNRSIFSRRLQETLRAVLGRGEQAILFLNRRGTATFVFCRDCGYILKCPKCELPLTFHTGAGHSSSGMFCHYCGYSRGLPGTCPTCSSKHIRQYGTGTEKVEAEVQALLPEARTLRWDWETTRTKGAHEIILSHFQAHRADILVGTQMLAKGLDLPLVTLVGVVLADVGLSLPDYRAGERAFQTLTQVAGRAGRSPLGGEVVLQTFQPDHYVIQAAAGHNYRQFYQQELQYRRSLGYPPFVDLVRMEYHHNQNDAAEAEARRMAARVHAWIEGEDRRATSLVGPVPCFFARIGGVYRWQIVLRGPDPASLIRDKPLGEWRVEVNPPSLL